MKSTLLKCAETHITNAAHSLDLKTKLKIKHQITMKSIPRLCVCSIYVVVALRNLCKIILSTQKSKRHWAYTLHQCSLIFTSCDRVLLWFLFWLRVHASELMFLLIDYVHDWLSWASVCWHHINYTYCFTCK